MARRLENRVIVITGASSGIGAATAIEAGRARMKVVLAARRVDKLDAVARRVEELGGEALTVETDVADDAQVQRLIDLSVERFGRIDVLFANAGYGFFEPVVDTDPDAERRIFDVNYFGVTRCIRAAGPVMRKQGAGHIIICTSIVGKIGLPYYASYSATKAALSNLAGALALELEPQGIDVSALFPVGTRTEFFASVAEQSGTDAISENTPEFMIQSAEHVARRVLRCVRRPHPEIWPSLLGYLGIVLWTLSPRFYRFCFRNHARWCRKTMERSAATPTAKSATSAAPTREPSRDAESAEEPSGTKVVAD
ncbi:MAG: SDR family NAD(P)-dependent oxidoreductase [Phycisphaera sp.]|nr:SDR family NAD(P)-dependent oxidoreductase [Phycisphaera sp.]